MSTTQQSPMVLAAEGAAAPVMAAPAAQVAVPAQTTATTVQTGQGKGGFSATPTLGEIAEFQVTGLLVVFVVLGAITALSLLMSALLKALAPNQYHCKKPATATAAAKAAPAPAAKAAPATASGLSQDKLLVLLAAAAQEVLGKSATVVSYKASDSSWALQGRVAHHHSHTL